MDIRIKPNTDVFFALATAIGLIVITTQAIVIFASLIFASLILVTNNGTYNTKAMLSKVRQTAVLIYR
jgi:hypothetical protein